MSSAGIIANPISGKDIRRLVAHGSTFDNNEKINIVRRVLIALDALDVERVYFMPDTYAIVPRAAEGIPLRLQLLELPMVTLGTPSDSLEAAQRLADLAVGCVVTLGGDGTNRVVAKGCRDTPIVAISTGTNNVFPRMVEGTLAGLAAGLVATGAVALADVARRQPWLDVMRDGVLVDRALIDVVASHEPWIGARALWDPSQISEIVLSRITPAAIGTCGLGGLLFPEACGSGQGVHVVVGEGERAVLAALAPGLIRRMPVAEAQLIPPGSAVRLRWPPVMLALDGEREIELPHGDQPVDVRFNPAGPLLVEIEAALELGARARAFDGMHSLPRDVSGMPRSTH
jgi:predicted polyphosphate/ATP-dependent NAD kinase